MRNCRQATVNRSAVTLVLAALLAALSGCAAGMRGSTPDGARGEITRGVGSTPVSLMFLTSYENVPGAPYYPLDGIAGCCFGPDGTLLVCDEKRGVVHALDKDAEDGPHVPGDAGGGHGLPTGVIRVWRG